jgi:ABC-2 type transport system permease protein
MKRLRFILLKEFRLIFRDQTILVLIFALPTVLLIMIPQAMDFDIKHINISVVDHDHSSYSDQLISKISSSGYFKLISTDFSYQKALQHIEEEESDLVLEIPAGFERNLVREGTQKIGISVDAINGTKATIGGAYLNSIISDFNEGLEINQGERSAGTGQAATIDITYRNWFNPRAEYKFYIVPGVLVLLLTMIGGFISALNIVREKETGTIEQINVTPIRKWEFILGKMIPFWIIGMIVFTIGLLLCWVVYGIVSVGSLWLLYLFAAVYMIALLGLGLLISTYSDSQIQAMFISFFFVMIFMLMSGLFTSIESMPSWARSISYSTPITHFMKVVRMIMLKGSAMRDMVKELGYIAAFAIFLNGWAIRNYKKTT